MKINWSQVRFTLYIFGILFLLQLGQGHIKSIVNTLSYWFTEHVEIIVSYLKLALFMIWTLGITYGFWKGLFKRNVWFRTAVLLLIPSIFYAYNLRLRVLPVYNVAKDIGDKIGKVYINSDTLGYRHLPNSTGYRPLEKKFVTITHDNDGCRIPVGYKHTGKRPLVMSFGCSVSYADACWAEDGFTHQVAKDLGGDYINAACSGYGASQMIIRAKELIPKYKPDYVIVQYTFWLAERSMKHYQEFFGGEFPIPFFSDNGLETPVFSPKGLQETPFSQFKDTPRSAFDFWHFFSKLAPYYVYQDVRSTWTGFKSFLGFTPKASVNRDRVENYAYGELARICRENNTQMIVWTTGTGFHLTDVRVIPPDTVYKLKIPIAYADSALYKRNNAWDRDTYARYYAHWWTPPGRKDSVVVDGHPNKLCHRIIADEIVKTIRESDAQKALAVEVKNEK
jgi:hypothetical protein